MQYRATAIISLIFLPVCLNLSSVRSGAASDPNSGGNIQAPSLMQGMPRIENITPQNWDKLESIIKSLKPEDAPLLIISKDCPRVDLPLPLPSFARVLDFRYDGATHLIRGNHPRINGIWPQYSGLATGLRENVTISDVITPDAAVVNFEGKAQDYRPLEYNTPEEYHSNHNHYQNLLSEVWNFNPSVNGVAIWGDAGAFVPQSKVWGAFFSARSWPLFWDKHLPPGWKPFKKEDFDAQLVGVEVDVLNAGKPWRDSKLAKTGVQIVGFGAQNTQAVEIRCEDSEAKPGEARKGQFMHGVVVYHGVDGSVLKAYLDENEAKTGIDFTESIFADGAIKINSKNENNGIILNNRNGGMIYSKNDILEIRMAKSGLKILSHDGKEILSLNEHSHFSRDNIVVKNSENNLLLYLSLIIAIISILLNLIVIYRIRNK